MRLPSVDASLLLLVTFGSTISAHQWWYREDFPRHSEPHRKVRGEDFGYCEKYAPFTSDRSFYWFDLYPNDFFKLCHSLPDSITLPPRDLSKPEDDQCKHFFNGTASIKYCSLDVCGATQLDNLREKCDKKVSRCFGTEEHEIEYSSAFTRWRSPAGYMQMSTEKTSTTIKDLGLKCNGTDVTDGQMPTEPRHMDPKEWDAHMARLIANDGA